MHFRTHVKEAHTGISGPSGNEYHDGMVEHDMHVGELLKLLDELGIAESTVVYYSTDNGLHFNTWPDAANTPFRSEKNSNWEGAYRVPAFIRWPGRFPAGTTLNGIVAHEDWLPTFAAAAGATDIKKKLKAGVELNGRKYRNYIDGYNLLDYLSGKSQTSPRKEFFYVNDDGQVVAIRLGDWKGVFLENRAQAFEVWREPFTELRVPCCSTCTAIPSRKPSTMPIPTTTGSSNARSLPSRCSRWRPSFWRRCRSTRPVKHRVLSICKRPRSRSKQGHAAAKYVHAAEQNDKPRPGDQNLAGRLVTA
jgi:hypothetical protein